jgi:DNA repair exonuclease SbcCD ATPase subunit
VNSLVQIIQAIATAVNAKMTMTLSQRISQLSHQMLTGSGAGWIDRSTASEGMRRQRLGTSAERVTQATEKRNDLKGKVDALGEFLINNAQTLTDKEFKQLQRALDQYTRQLDRAREVLKKVTDSDKKLKEENDRLTRAENAASLRQPKGIWGQVQNAYTNLRRKIGPSGRKRLLAVHDVISSVLNPKRAKAKAATARSRADQANKAYYSAKAAHNQAMAVHRKNLELHQRSPTVQTAKDVASSENTLKKTRHAVVEAGQTVQALAEVATGLEGIAAVGAFINPVIAGIASAFALAVVVVSAALVFINKTLASAQKEVERFRSERSHFSSQVAGAVARYDAQSLQLEQRSTRATSGSATEVIKATMNLRESMQDRSERWENIANQLLSATISVATFASDVLSSVDIVTPVAEGILAIGRSILTQFGIKLDDISKNTSKSAGNMGLDVIQLLNNENRNARGNKAFPPLKPIK